MGKKLGRRSAIGLLLSAALAVLLGCQAAPAPAATATTAPAKPAAPTAAAAPATAPAAQPTAAPAAPTAVPAAAAEVLKLGISAGITGPGTRVGTNTDRFIRLALDDANAKGGVKAGGKTYRFEAVTADDKGTSDGGREAANRLVLSEKVKFILGPVSSPIAGAQAITEPAKVAILGVSAVDKSLGTAFPLTLQMGASHNITRSAAIYEWLAKDHPNVKKVVAVMPDDATGRAIADLAEANIKAKGGTMLSKEFYPSDLKDFTPLVARVLRQNPDAIDLGPGGARGPLFLAFMKSANDQGYSGKVVATSGETGSLREGAGFIKDFTMSFLLDWKSPVVSAGEKDVIQRIAQKYGETDLEIIPMPMYAAFQILVQAIEKAGTVDDPEKVVKTMREGQWDTMLTAQYGKTGFLGAKTFGLPSVMDQPVYLSRVAGSKMETISAVKAVLP